MIHPVTHPNVLASDLWQFPDGDIAIIDGVPYALQQQCTQCIHRTKKGVKQAVLDITTEKILRNQDCVAIATQ